MLDMSQNNDGFDKVTKVVFFSTRYIEKMDLFGGVNAVPVFSAAITHYFRCLDDDFSSWLLDKVPDQKSDREMLSDTLRDIGISLLERIDIHGQGEITISDYIANSTDRINLIKANILNALAVTYAGPLLQGIIDLKFKKPIWDDSTFYEKTKDECLDASVTHLDLQSSASARVEHRLGVYFHEKGEYAVCAVWPWFAPYENNHSDNWKNAIIQSVRERYRNVHELLLMLHDKDFAEHDGKDEVIALDLNQDEQNCLVNQEGKRMIVSFAVFRHGNSDVEGAMHKKTAKECFDTLSTLMITTVFKSADKENSIASAYTTALNASRQ